LVSVKIRTLPCEPNHKPSRAPGWDALKRLVTWITIDPAIGHRATPTWS